MSADFTIRIDPGNQYYWTFQINNQETIARSSKSYINRSDCLHSIKVVRDLSSDVPVWDVTGEKAKNVMSELSKYAFNLLLRSLFEGSLDIGILTNAGFKPVGRFNGREIVEHRNGYHGYPGYRT